MLQPNFPGDQIRIYATSQQAPEKVQHAEHDATCVQAVVDASSAALTSGVNSHAVANAIVSTVRSIAVSMHTLVH